jgi:hypothetical protein
MEVHHHAHHEGKKNWKSYFGEFLMLFLAVFCGFLAEYQLEQTLEKHREKEMITSLIEDLKTDTSLYNVQFNEINKNKIVFDSIVILLTSPQIKEKGADLYYYGRWPFRYTFIKFTDRTIQQLKNAGNYRLIKNKIVSDSILTYYSNLERLYKLQDQIFQRLEEYIVKSRDLFDPRVFELMVNDKTNSITKLTGNPLLLSYERKPILDILSAIHNLKSGYRGIGRSYLDRNKEANELIKLLKNEYHLE